jgi:hypothetical protein
MMFMFGLFTGASMGFVIAALLAAGKQTDREIQDAFDTTRAALTHAIKAQRARAVAKFADVEPPVRPRSNVWNLFGGKRPVVPDEQTPF